MPIPWEVDGVSALEEQPPATKRFAWLMASKSEFEAIIEPEHLALKRKIALFGSNSMDLVYNFGPYRSMVNTAVAEWPALQTDALVRLSGDDRYRDIDPGGSSVPAYVGGEIGNASALDGFSDLTIAVAVNGTIRSTTKLRQEDGRLRFLARIPIESFVKGRNEVTVHGVVEDERGEPASLIHFARK